MNQSNDNNMNETDANNLTSAELNVSAIDSINDDLIERFYSEDSLLSVIMATLNYIDKRINTGMTLPYFADISHEQWQQKPKALDIYITDEAEGRELNLEARGKNYATNILSYPSEMPANILELMPTLPLGELIICHEVMVREAAEQNKTVAQHISHLLIHGMLHLLGFDHELGQTEQDEMESFEIEILAGLNLPNPYI
ncbi:rRNA maturation RNase YbeY [Psychrobacter sp. Sarcosine-3u-12]|uniref:rRNA maturation RNase YbeY n=1 Tax=Psychrobacter sp. Sarcosine-3u-12 TaxID=2058325 RepID=UPI000C31D38E|nr:rRNA maturation RNase YbeY [Psychrobacter sp. Sarcosine-3u-12]PKG35523.1 rRNA maturation RNase YbeY [Psychrobacter sp. Sarcosine-3u-12]